MSKASRTLTVLVLIIPLVFTTTGIDPAFSIRALLLSVGTIAILWFVRREKLAATPLLILWGAYILCTLVSIFAAQNFGEAIYASVNVLLYGCFFVAASAAARESSIRSISRACMALALIVSLIGLAQFYEVGFGWIPGGGPPTATMTTKNMLSSFLFLLLPFVTFTALTDEQRWRWAALAAWAGVMLTLLIAQTRSVWLAVIVFLIVANVCHFFFYDRGQSIRPVALRTVQLALIAFICAGYVFTFHVSSRTVSDEPVAGAQTRPFMSYTSSDTSATMRLTVWRQSMKMHKDHPFGVGTGNWKIELPHYGLAQSPVYIQNGNYQWTHAHNDFISVLCETGIQGLLVYFTIFGYALLAAIRSARRANNPNDRILFVLLAGCVAGFGVISFFDFPKARTEHMMIFALVLAVIDALSAFKEKQGTFPPVLFLVLTPPALYFAGLHFTAEQHERNVTTLRQEQNWPAVIEECNKAYNAKLLSLDELSTPILYYKAEAEFMQNDLNSALRDNLEALKAHPYHIYTLNNTGSCYTRLSNFRLAKVFYTRALAISPNFEESLLNLTAVYYNEGNYAKALEYVNRCDTSVPDSRAASIARVVRSKIK